MKVFLISSLVIIGALILSFKDRIKALIPLIKEDSTKDLEETNFLKNVELRGIDGGGNGSFGASRGTRTHKGLDVLAKKGDIVKAPFDCVINRLGFVYSGDYNYKLIEVTGTNVYKDYKCKIMYSVTNFSPSKKEFKQGEKIGVAQDIAKKYTSVKNHLHYEIYNPKGVLVNPQIFL